MKLERTESLDFEHVHVVDLGTPLPLVLKIDEGYRRGCGIRTKSGEYISLIGVSNIKAEESTPNYILREDEEVISLFGLMINKKMDAEILSEHFRTLAAAMPE